ncbi:hypothetical protein AAE02nite_13830 [Adhaeribacter aerolatus]|uniref:beta-galactosidase n=1 Tax=Adhaeribacter aerolatus TaxID=670289 RepID=A0A512AVH4_9BACT|nr:glycoside hydrolase family 2 TIM barrel-domain containing protein [Adhaeribacter aerolatus]GEO03719.1 hypothetical protein AAE02nite_13830 [Adhaeribacter aerolatus]
MKGFFIFYTFLSFLTVPASAQETIKHYLSGTDKDHTVTWDFYVDKGRNSGKWSKIQVPSNWELQGFGNYNYGQDLNKPEEQGKYKHTFKADNTWKNKKIFIVFEGAMTDTEVKVNGQLAGPVHQGGFYRFKYDITNLIKFNEDNLLEATVSKASANISVNNAERNGDFWALGGIFRPVYLEIVPEVNIDRIAIDARADGNFTVEVFGNKLTDQYTVLAQVQQINGKKFGPAFAAKGAANQEKTVLKSKFKKPALWNPEFPHLYKVTISLKGPEGIIHTKTEQFGFRTVETRPRDGLYVNGQKVILKGVNRHSAWPESGRTLSKKLNRMDINLMKDMNMNAVRMSHYPPDQDFLDLCDSLGLFVLNELTGWQAEYDTEVGRKLVKELVIRDVNHPSIIFWNNGNERGWNFALDNDFDLYDPQKRTVLHPIERLNGYDTKHYITYDYLVNSYLYEQELLLPTEFMHGLYDGGHGAGLDDF